MPNGPEAPAPLTEVRAAIQNLRQQRAEQQQTAAGQAGEIAQQAAVAAARAQEGDAESFADAQAAINGLRTQRRAALDQLRALDTQEINAIAGLINIVDPCDAEADVPIALLPVRLETRFNADGSSLMVRIYPDDAHIDRLDEGLSDDERTAAIAYWTAMWTGTSDESTAWDALVQAVKPERAPWVAHALTPTNLGDRPTPPAAAPAPVFPDTAPRRLFRRSRGRCPTVSWSWRSGAPAARQ